jgi:hypothetical protein
MSLRRWQKLAAVRTRSRVREEEAAESGVVIVEV